MSPLRGEESEGMSVLISCLVLALVMMAEGRPFQALRLYTESCIRYPAVSAENQPSLIKMKDILPFALRVLPLLLGGLEG